MGRQASIKTVLNGLGVPSVLPSKKKDGSRRLSVHREDEVGAELAKCGSIGEVGEFAVMFGLRRDDVVERAKKAPNFGQFRMTVGNLVRGVISRIQRAKEKYGVEAEPADAAYPKEFSAYLRKVRSNFSKAEPAPAPKTRAKRKAKNEPGNKNSDAGAVAPVQEGVPA